MDSFSSILVIVSLIICAEAQNRLLLVQTIWSPGSHSPLVFLPSETANETNSWPDGLGALTSTGLKQSLQLGALLRRRYFKGFQLFDGSLNRQIYAASSNVDLALTTAYAVIAGLQSANTTDWRPFPVHVEEDQESLVWNADCPLADTTAKQQTLASPWFQSKINLNFIREIVANAGYGPFRGIDQLYLIWDALNSIRENVHPLPIWAKSEDIDQLKGLLDVSAALSYSHESVARLRGGRLLESIVNKIMSKIACMGENSKLEKCTSMAERKMYTYSTDDMTLYAFLGALGAAPSVVQDPTSAVSIELWKNWLGRFEIKVVAKTIVDGDFSDVRVSGCMDVVCDVPKFVARSDKFISGNWHSECGMEAKFEFDESPVHPDCFDVKDRSESKNCFDWATADYCEKQIAVKYLFCRKTCLCNPRFAKFSRRSQ